MKRDPEEIEAAALPHGLLKRHQKLYHFCARYEMPRYVVGDCLSAGTRWYVFCAQVQRWAAPDIGWQTIKRMFSAPSCCATAVIEGVNVNSEAGAELLSEFSIAIAPSDVRDCFHRFRMSLSLSGFFCLRAVLAHVLSMTGEMLEGQRLEARAAIWSCWRMLPIGFSLSLSLVQSCNEEKACFAPSLRRTSDKSTTVDSRPWTTAGAISSSHLDWLSTKPGNIWAGRRPSGQSWTEANFAHG